ncbi:hypothetical protein [Aurantimonas sp. C2-4-R8]|uniref:hypothetical protein n=1 Tax=Aurantimonas sp. C2-4-R8 TaxID=3114364 RepID=UPI002E179447|nr:hypothetical protein [Aurantimonas sp. C2-4-R8]
MDGKRRPLIIVYDEGHNLTDQQTDLLLELEPQALLVASATLRTAPKLMRMIERLRDHGWSDDRLYGVLGIGMNRRQGLGLLRLKARADPAALPDIGGKFCFGSLGRELRLHELEDFREGLAVVHADEKLRRIEVRVGIVLRARLAKNAPDHLLDLDVRSHALVDVGKAAFRIIPPFLQGEIEDDVPVIAFLEQRVVILAAAEQNEVGGARIFLVEFEVAINRDFGRIDAGGFSQVSPYQDRRGAALGERLCRIVERAIILIFVGLADIDRLRPERRAELFRLRFDRAEGLDHRLKGQIHRGLIATERDLAFDEAGGDNIAAPDRGDEPIAEAMAALRDYRADAIYTVGEGRQVRALQTIGSGAAPVIEEQRTEHSNPVLARFVLRRALQAQHPKVANVINWADPKLDARIEINSLAAQELRNAADELVGLYLDHTRLVCEDDNPHEVGPILTNPDKLVRFNNALHDGYSDLNPDEEEIAHALDRTGHTWARNPAAGGFSIPLLDRGRTRNFYPDFLVWKGETVFAIDPKGEPYLATDAGRKLLSIRDESGKQLVLVRLVTAGKWNGDTLRPVTQDGYTAWTLTNTGKIRARHKATVSEIVDVCLDERF